MIPKIIHRVWVSNDNSFPDEKTITGKCMNSQDKLKEEGYEIRTYTSKNFDFSISEFLIQAYALKRYGFIVDYIRLWCLYYFGGIYLDTDVEIFNSFDPLLSCGYFMGYMKDDDNINTNDYESPEVAVIGSNPYNPFIKMVLDYYDNHPLIDESGLIHARFHNDDLGQGKFGHILYDINNVRPKLINDENEYKILTNNIDLSTFYFLNNNWLRCSTYQYNKKDYCICSHRRAFTWQYINKVPDYIQEYSKKEIKEYNKKYNQIKNKTNN